MNHKNHKNHLKQLHKELKKHSPKSVKKTEEFFGFKYPKLLFLILSITLAYFIFKNPAVGKIINNLEGLSYIGTFFAGMLLTFGFSAPFAVGFFISYQPQNILLTAVIGGIGASFADNLLFKFIKISFMNEFENLKKIKLFKKMRKILNENFSIKVKHYFLYIFAGIIIATPLPDEIGVSMLAGLTTIKQKVLAITSFILHCLAILIILKASM